MKMSLLGYRKLDFMADGEAVKGVQLFVAFEEEGVQGQITDKLFIRPDMPLPENLKIGETIDVIFNRRGRPESIKAVRG